MYTKYRDGVTVCKLGLVRASARPSRTGMGCMCVLKLTFPTYARLFSQLSLNLSSSPSLPSRVPFFPSPCPQNTHLYCAPIHLVQVALFTAHAFARILTTSTLLLLIDCDAADSCDHLSASRSSVSDRLNRFELPHPTSLLQTPQTLPNHHCSVVITLLFSSASRQSPFFLPLDRSTSISLVASRSDPPNHPAHQPS